MSCTYEITEERAKDWDGGVWKRDQDKWVMEREMDGNNGARTRVEASNLKKINGHSKSGVLRGNLTRYDLNV